jgi:hypothetical protein
MTTTTTTMRTMTSLALSAAVLAACSSNYTPQSRGRVSVMMRDGAPAYVRDGRVHEHGMFGGGLVDVVQGHPSAVNAAHEYRDRLIGGFIGTIGGLVCMMGATGYAASQLDYGDNDGDDGNAKTALLVALGCSVITIVGAGYMATAEPYRWDAINLFNDSPPPPTMMPAPGYAPPPLPPQASLRMRERDLVPQ